MKIKNRAILLFFVSVIAGLSGCNLLPGSKEESQLPIQSEEKQSTVQSVDGSSISYGSSGEGDITIVFIHCWTCNSEFWEPQIEHFSKNNKVVWLDLAGHGQSGSQRQQYTMPAFGNDVASVVNQIGTDKVVLVGHSMGGPVAIETAKILGDKVLGIVGVDTFYTPFEAPTSEEKIEGFLAPFKQDFPSASEQLVRPMFTPSAPPEVVDQIVRQMGAANPEMGVSAISEVFKWIGTQASSDLKQYAGKLRNINGAPTGKETALDESVVLIPEVGHFVPQVKPDEFNQALEQIIAEYQTD